VLYFTLLQISQSFVGVACNDQSLASCRKAEELMMAFVDF
jgi:hypothetical protein